MKVAAQSGKNLNIHNLVIFQAKSLTLCLEVNIDLGYLDDVDRDLPLYLNLSFKEEGIYGDSCSLAHHFLYLLISGRFQF